MGFDAVNPQEMDLLDHVLAQTNGVRSRYRLRGVGIGAGASMMTDLLRTRGLAIVVAIFGQPQQVDLFRFFWRELRMIGVRVYESQDFDRAIEAGCLRQTPFR